jgi:hypothetical protein
MMNAIKRVRHIRDPLRALGGKRCFASLTAVQKENSLKKLCHGPFPWQQVSALTFIITHQIMSFHINPAQYK